MQHDLNHLPKSKRKELSEIVRLIRHRAEVELIVLFGSYARGDWKEDKDIDPEQWSGHPSDYDILVVVADRSQVEDTLLWKQVTDELESKSFTAKVRPIVRDVNEINMALAEGRYFFIDLYSDGCVLYDSGRYQIDEPDELGPESHRRLAQEYFDIWLKAAKQNVRGFEFFYNDNDLRRAAFQLNQATESAYKCMLLVFSLYSPHEHRLETLGRMAAQYGPVFEEIFPRGDQRQRQCFDQLDLAYIGSRYHPRFMVSQEELDYLAPRVRRLIEVVERICQAELERLSQSV